MQPGVSLKRDLATSLLMILVAFCFDSLRKYLHLIQPALLGPILGALTKAHMVPTSARAGHGGFASGHTTPPAPPAPRPPGTHWSVFRSFNFAFSRTSCKQNRAVCSFLKQQTSSFVVIIDSQAVESGNTEMLCPAARSPSGHFLQLGRRPRRCQVPPHEGLSCAAPCHAMSTCPSRPLSLHCRPPSVLRFYNAVISEVPSTACARGRCIFPASSYPSLCDQVSPTTFFF